jgi:hypothetical protein
VWADLPDAGESDAAVSAGACMTAREEKDENSAVAWGRPTPNSLPVPISPGGNLNTPNKPNKPNVPNNP